VQGLLNGVSCTSAPPAAAAGDHIDDAGNQVPLMESWNGASWKIKSAPAAAIPPYLGHLLPGRSGMHRRRRDIKPVRPSRRWRLVSPLVESLNGKAWTIPLDAGPEAGWYTTRSRLFPAPLLPPVSPSARVRAGRWDALRDLERHQMDDPVDARPPQRIELGLTAVSCVAPSYCVANRLVQTGDLLDRFTLSRSGMASTWTIQSMPTYPDGALFSVPPRAYLHFHPRRARPSGGTDANGSSTLVETWNGTNWEVPSTRT